LRKLIFLFLSVLLFADNIPLISAFKKGHYSKICMNRWKYINKYLNKREDLLSLVAYSCLKKRYLTPALDLAKVLKKTTLGRKNATYITTLFLMKKLLLEFIFDNLDIKNIKLPVIKDTTLGEVFYNIQNNNFIKDNKKLIIQNNEKKLIVYPNKNYNIVIETIIDNRLQKREIYW
jgi:hypothetical protein